MNQQIPIREYEEAVYVYWFGPNLPTVKIGHSSNPDKRLAALGNDTGVPDHLASFAAIVWLDRKREQVEAKTHTLASKFRRSGEWFELTASDALGYIISAAEELNIRYEVEDRAGLLAATRQNLRVDAKKSVKEIAEEAYGIDKWGPDLKAKVAAEVAASKAEADAELVARKAEADAEDAADAAADARRMVDEADEDHRVAAEAAAQAAKLIADAAENAKRAARKAADDAAYHTTAAYRATANARKASMPAYAAYRKANPVLTAVEQEARYAEGDAKRIAAWKAKWGADLGDVNFPVILKSRAATGAEQRSDSLLETSDLDAKFAVGITKDLSHGYWYGGQWYALLAEATKVAEGEQPSGERDYKYAMLHFTRNRQILPNDQTAFDHFLRAARMGHAGAQEKLSAIFLAGSAPVSKDLVEACAWCTMAAKGGNAEASARLPIIKKQLNSDESVGAMQRCQSLRNEIRH